MDIMKKMNVDAVWLGISNLVATRFEETIKPAKPKGEKSSYFNLER
jgi:hypothetical protein